MSPERPRATRPPRPATSTRSASCSTSPDRHEAVRRGDADRDRPGPPARRAETAAGQHPAPAALDRRVDHGARPCPTPAGRRDARSRVASVRRGSRRPAHGRDGRSARGLDSGTAGRGTGQRDDDREWWRANRPDRPPADAWLPIAAAVLAVLLIVGIAYAVTQSGDDDEPTTPAAGTRRHRPPKLRRPARPRRRVRPPPPPRRRPPRPSPSTPRPTSTARSKTSRRSSKDLGLEPVRGERGDRWREDTVADIAPTGEVPEGTQVTLAVYTGEDEEPGNSDENGHGPKPSKPKEN